MLIDNFYTMSDEFFLTEAFEQKKLFGENSSAKPEELEAVDKEITQELTWVEESRSQERTRRFPKFRLSLRKIKLERLNEIIGLKDKVI